MHDACVIWKWLPVRSLGWGFQHRMRATPVIETTYPVNLIVSGRSCLVVGGGNVAIQKVSGLVKAGAQVTVVAPEIRDEIREMPVKVFERPYRRGEVASYRLAITCTDNSDVNRQVFEDAEASGIWANSADDVDNCAWILPSVTRSGGLTLAVSTGGKSPAMAQWLRRRFTEEVDYRYENLLELLAKVRSEAKQELGTSEVAGWQAALDDDLFDLVASGDDEAAYRRLRKHLGLSENN